MYSDAEAAPAAPEEDAGGGMSLAGLPELNVSDFRLAYRDGETGQVSEAAFDEVSLASQGGGHLSLIRISDPTRQANIPDGGCWLNNNW